LKMGVFKVAPPTPILCYTATRSMGGTSNCAQKR